MRFSPAHRSLAWLTARPIAHRGLHDRSRGIVENTRSAFAAAVAGGFAIECDLQMTRDGEAVVFHDDTLDRLTDATGPVIARSVAELKAVRFREGADQIQTLAELLTQVNGSVPLVIELKSHWNGSEALAERVLKVLEPYSGPYCLMSFDPDIIAAVRRLSPMTVRGIVADRAHDPEYNTLPLARRIEMRTLSHLTRTQPHFISFYERELPWSPVTEFRNAGHPVISWTIRSREQAARAMRYSDQVTFEGYAP